MGQIQWTVSLVMFGLFAVAMISFAIGFANDNDAIISVLDDPELSKLNSEIGSNLSTFGSGAEDTYNSTISSSISPTAASGTITTAGQFAITPGSIIGVVSNTLKVGYTKIFGGGGGFEIFISTFLGLIVFITALYIWKTWAGRSPD